MEKIVLGVSGVVALGTCLYTINRGTNGTLRPDLAELISNPQAAQKNPKLAAYMFAGRAFGYGSAIAVASTITLCCAIALSIGATNFKDFSSKSQTLAQRAFPKLRGKLTVDKEGEDAFFEELDKGVEEKELNPTYMKIKRVFQEHGL